MIANEVVYGVKNRENHDFLFKINSHKAFDSILWDYVNDDMVHIGLGIMWRSLIKECFSSSKMIILVNRSPSNRSPSREFSLQMCL